MNYTEMNRIAWDERTKIHVKSEFYKVDHFLKGACTLNPVELAQLGDVKNKSLLHLQCHFGMDTLSWARKGAKVTGVDLSPVSIEKARSLAHDIEESADFLCSDVLEFSHPSNKKFDVVYTSYGALCWLANLKPWAEVIANCLEQSGEFHMVEFHPAFDLISGYSYFPIDKPDVYEEGTYTENTSKHKVKLANWSHPISEVISSLINVGLRIECVEEFPFNPYNCFKSQEFVEGKGYQVIHKGQQVPMLYAIKAKKY